MSHSAAGHSTISEAVIYDHKELGEFYERYTKAQSVKEQQEWSNQFRWELARHSVGEELVVYPAQEKYLGEEGKRLADNDRADHLKLKELLVQLDGTDVEKAEHPELFKKLVDELSGHVKSEEENDLKLLEAALPREESARLAASFQLTKKFVPTRAHPSVPDQGGLYETAAGLLIAPIDKLKDLFDSWPSSEQTRV